MATVYKSTADGIYKTLNNGTSWSDVTPESGYEYVDLVKKGNNTVYVLGNKDTAGTFSSKIWKTTTAGVSWPTSALIGGEPAAGCSEKGTKSSNFSAGNWGINQSEWSLGNPILNVAADKYVIIYEDTSEGNTYVRAFSMSGDTISWGSAVDIDAPSLLEGGLLFIVDTDKFGVIYNTGDGIGQLGVPAVKIGTLSGTAITLGSAQYVMNTYENINLDGINEVGEGLSAACPTSSTIVVTRYGKIMETSGSSCVESSDFGWWSMWGTISGTAITWEEWDDCGSVDLETVGKWRDVVRSLTIADQGVSVSIRLGSVGLTAFTYDVSSITRLVVVGYDGTENNQSSEVLVDAAISGVRGFCLFELTSVKAIALWIEYTGSVYELYGSVISMSGITPLAGSANLLKTSSGFDYFDNIFGTALTSTEAVVSYTLSYTGDCQTNLILDISGDTITVSETCDSMNEYAAGVHGHTSTKYMLMGWESDSPFDGVIWAGITADDVSECAGVGEGKGISIDVSGDQQNAYVTFCDGASLQVTSLSANNLNTIRTTSLGEATMAETASNIRIAYVKTTETQSDRVWITGRMINPAGLSAASPVQIINSQDAGQTFSAYQTGWGGDFAGAAKQKNTTSPFYSVRNLSDSTQAAFYKNKIVTGTVPFGVHHRAMAMPTNGDYAILGASNTDTQRIYYSVSPYIKWHNVTRNYPNAASSNGGAITGVVVV